MVRYEWEMYAHRLRDLWFSLGHLLKALWTPADCLIYRFPNLYDQLCFFSPSDLKLTSYGINAPRT